MKTKKILFLSALLLAVISSCIDYLEPYPVDDRSGEEMWKYPEMIQGLIGQAYTYLPINYNDNEGAYLDCATDNAVSTSTTRDIRLLALNSITTKQDFFRNYWERDYKAILLCNTFLKDNRGYRLRYLIVPSLDNIIRRRLQGEAYGLRAWFQWDLLQKFGGKGTNGAMLGFPIVKSVIDYNDEVNLTRNTYDQCVQQILDDCDSAYKYLPIAYRDYLVPVVAERAYLGSPCWGRIDGITTRAIKAMVYLTWASPRFNPANDLARWDNAAKYAKEVIDFKLTKDNVTNGFNPVNQVNWLNPNFPGLAWVSKFATSDAMERMFYPGGFQGSGTMGATQDLVDAFPDTLGYPVTHALTVYNPAKPYAKRDRRFYSMIFYNMAQAKKNNTTPVMYTFNNWANGGKDAAGVSSTNSRTNYHIKKFIYMGLDLTATTKDIQRHSKFFVEWAHMCLAFAEAANHVTGNPNTALYGLTPKAAIKYLRSRKTYDGASGLTSDPYLDEVANAGEAAFDAFIKNERRIETCFEGMRFFDLRRWSTSLTDLNKPVHGVSVVKNTDGTFTYNLNQEIESRVYKSAYLPIPYTEVLNMSNLIQNEGWDSWE